MITVIFNKELRKAQDCDILDFIKPGTIVGIPNLGVFKCRENINRKFLIDCAEHVINLSMKEYDSDTGVGLQEMIKYARAYANGQIKLEELNRAIKKYYVGFSKEIAYSDGQDSSVCGPIEAVESVCLHTIPCDSVLERARKACEYVARINFSCVSRDINKASDGHGGPIR